MHDESISVLKANNFFKLRFEPFIKKIPKIYFSSTIFLFMDLLPVFGDRNCQHLLRLLIFQGRKSISTNILLTLSIYKSFLKAFNRFYVRFSKSYQPVFIIYKNSIIVLGIEFSQSSIDHLFYSLIII